MNPTVCILTAGIGTRMGSYTTYINKALLPINQKAAISHIIDKFPKDTQFVVAIGHLGYQVKDYLTIAHPSLNISFVKVDNYKDPGSGPGHSLSCCKHLLDKPFYYVSCDTLWENDINMDIEENWVGTSKTNVGDTKDYCNFKIEHDHIVSIHDKIHVEGDDYRKFIGLCHIKDYDIFWNGLNSPKLIKGERQISNGIQALVDERIVKQYDIEWTDIGTLENYKNAVNRYEKYDFSKTDEFIYIDNERVIKFFADKTVVEKRIARTTLNPGVFPIIDNRRGQFYCYRFIPGKTLYEVNNIHIFKKLLRWLDKNLWKDVDVDIDNMSQLCKTFYYEKTLDRLSVYHNKYKNTDVENVINGIKVPATSDLIRQIPWEKLYSGKPIFFHGDLNFGNIICTNQKNFVLLDWRQDFGGHIEFGDLYYDLAKLYCGIILNYDYVKDGLINYKEEGSAIYFDFAQRYSAKYYLTILTHFIRENGWDEQKVHILVPLIFLNMSPLHHYPFDKMLYALGRLILVEELKNNNEEKRLKNY